MINRPKYFASSAMLISSCLPLAPAIAQDRTLEEVVVTAQLKSQSLQDVPISITALSADDMAVRSVTNVLDMNESTPNLNISRNTGTSSGAKIFMRGIGEDDSRVTNDPAIGIYVDDIYLGRQTGSLIDLVDVERVEVLRGPQGTLYGRNTNGGAIRIVTKKPDQEFNFKASVDYGNYDKKKYFATVSGGLTESLSGQVSLKRETGEGFIKDTETSNRYGDVDTLGFRAALRYQGENWEALLSADYLDDQSDPGYPVMPKGYDNDDDLFSISQSQFNPVFPNGRGTLFLDDFFNDLKQSGASLNISGMILDNLQLTSITGYRKMSNELASNMGGNYYQDVTQSQFSQEFRLSSSVDSHEWITGLYFYTEESNQYTEYVMGSEDINLKTNSIGLFGEYTYHVNDQISLISGLRYTHEKKELDAGISDDYWYPIVFGYENLGALRQDNTWEHVSWKFVADYSFDSGSMAYLSVTNGFKSGGWSTDSLDPVDEETVLTWELGYKTQLFDDTLRLNSAVFYNDYQDLQLNGSTPGGGFTRLNAGAVEIYGLELDASWMPTDHITISGYLGTLHGEYKSFSDAAMGIVDENADLKHTPEISYGGILTHRLPTKSGQLTSSIQYAFQDEQWTDLSNTAPLKREETGIINARISHEWYGDYSLTLALWGKNLTNEEYYEASMASNHSVYPGDPRTWGVSVQLEM